MKLTDHFDLSEFTRSSIAKTHGINNSIPDELIPNIRNLCINVLEPLRTHINSSPNGGGREGAVLISSGYRCPELNRLVGGVPNSQHLTGEAADIIPSPLTPNPSALRDWFLWIMDNCPFDQLIFERSGPTRWIHVSYREGHNRQQVLRNPIKP